ncbi:MAG: hypothetical protein VX768_06525 [Planctomycetota bacterium]|nr:hypothetical protein [Planctomycetota bacterium]
MIRHFRPNQASAAVYSSGKSTREQLRDLGFGFEEDGDSILVIQKGLFRGDKVPVLIVGFLVYLALNVQLSVGTVLMGGQPAGGIGIITFLGSMVFSFFLLPVYCGIVHGFNRTRTRISRTELLTEDDGPLPWR